MIRMMRADAYRVIQDKALYIALSILIAVVALVAFVFQSVPDVLLMFLWVLDGDALSTGFTDGAAAAQMALFLIPGLTFLFLPLFRAVTIGSQDGVMKNEISAGFSRIQLYLSKWLLSSLLSMVYVLIFFALTVLSTATISGFGDWNNGMFAGILRALGMQLLFVMGFNSIGVFLSFLFKKAYVVVEVYLFALLMPVFISILFGLVDSPAGDLLRFLCLTTQATTLAPISGVQQADIVTGLLVGLAFIVILNAIGVFRFKKAEIK